jgi:hypothetical protein
MYIVADRRRRSPTRGAARSARRARVLVPLRVGDRRRLTVERGSAAVVAATAGLVAAAGKIERHREPPFIDDDR